jgi:glycine cleavage system H protein
MPAYPDDRRYTQDHTWVMMSAGSATVGLTSFATRQLGEVVFVEVPRVGDPLDAGESFGTVESVKAVAELFMPIAGSISEVNQAVVDDPEPINEDPYGEGWIVRIAPSAKSPLDELLDSKAYEAYTLAEQE